MLSLVFKRRLLLRCPQAAAFTPCRRLWSHHQPGVSDADITHHENAPTHSKGTRHPSSRAAEQRPGHDSPLRSENLGRTVVLDSCDGVVFKNASGKEYLDAMTGSPLAQPEAFREDLARVTLQQMLKLGVPTDQRNLTNSSANKLCKRLSEIAAQSFPDKMADSHVFLTTGQDAGIEAAYHLALRFWNRSGVLGTKFLGGYNKQKIITLRNGYHGSTFIPASMSSTSSEYGWARWMDGHDRDVIESNPHRMFTCIDPPHELFLEKLTMRPAENVGQAAARQLEERILAEGAKNIAAFVFEPVQALGGAVDMHRDFFPLAEEICKKYSILMISDETISSVKTGHWFGMEIYGVCPDIVILGDGLTCGHVPAGAIIARKDICQTAFKGFGTKLPLSDSWHHDFTGSSHPTCSTSALRTLDVIENENLLELCASRGKDFLAILKSELDGLSAVAQIRGTGLIIGVDLMSQIALEIEERLLLEYDILLGRSVNKHCLLLMPSCAMSNEQFEKIAKALKKILSSFSTIAESALRRKRNA